EREHEGANEKEGLGRNMILKAIRRIFFCSRNSHVRSRKHAKVGGRYPISQCNYCGIAMVKRGNGKWEADDT
ncbi:hypothetical protein, partial [Sphingorhabdus sp.]|uniref:hypothetical protein n=1 Tax=Sphingorhabdus sp. TaxID=1902408 RepID=UPI002FDD4AD0